MLSRIVLAMVLTIGGGVSLPLAASAADKPPADGWHPIDQNAAALAQAKKLNRPVAVLWYADAQKAGVVGRWVDLWKQAGLPKDFVCIEIVSKTQNNAIQIVEPLLIKLLQNSKIDPRGLRPPYILLGNADAAFYGLIEIPTTAPDAVRILRAAKAKHPPAVGGGAAVVERKPDKAKPLLRAEKSRHALAIARKLWSVGTFTGAMVHYRKLAAFVTANPEAAVAAELKKDEPAINNKGASELKKAKRLLAAGKFAQAVKETKRIRATYAGFETADKAEELFEKIKASHQERVAKSGDNKPESRRKRKASIWYEADERAEAFKRAAMLGRPVVLVWYIKGQDEDKIQEVKRSSDISKNFIGILMLAKILEKKKDAVTKGNVISMDDPFLQGMFSTSGIKGGLSLPYAFFGTSRGECLGYSSAQASARDLRAAAQAAVKKYGWIPSTRQALAAWKMLKAARKLWEEEKFDKALANYRKILALKAINPRLPILAEVDKDSDAVNRRGYEELQAAEQLIEDNKLEQAEAKVREIYDKYKGFNTAKDAKELHAKVKTKLKEKAIAAKEIKKDAVAEPPRKPAADDKPAANDEKNDDGNDNKQGEDYEDDF